MKIIDVFDIKNAKSKGFEDHESGVIPFISNGLENNGVVGLVNPLRGERVFCKTGICVSAFCEATVQNAPYLPRGNGGSGLTVLLPKEETPEAKLYWYAACINAKRWRFSFGRMVKKDRLNNLDLNEPPEDFRSPVLVSKLLPHVIKKVNVKRKTKFEFKTLEQFFEVLKGKGKYFEKCKEGRTPLISATGGNNGIIGLVNIAPTFKAPAITIERVSGNAFVQLENFATVPDDIFVLRPKQKICTAELFYFATMLNRQKWKFNYSRKVTPTRLYKLRIPVPMRKNKTNLIYIKDLLGSSYGWNKVTN